MSDAPRTEIALGKDGVARYRTGVPVDLAENDADECERCEGTGDRYGRRPYAGVPSARCPDCKGTGCVIPPEGRAARA